MWDGYNIRGRQQDRALVSNDQSGAYVVFDPLLVFIEPAVAPHEGLHLYYRSNPPAGLDYFEPADYRVIHGMIYQQAANECATTYTRPGRRR
jgi:hypothetical protein